MTTIVTASELRRDAQEFLHFKRAMGIVYRRAEFDLDGFVHFLSRSTRVITAKWHSIVRSAVHVRTFAQIGRAGGPRIWLNWRWLNASRSARGEPP
jgi:hypothetical protein